MTRLELACRTRNDVRLWREHDVLDLAPDDTRKAREPLRWSVDVQGKGTTERFSVVPDGLFGLAFPDETAAYFLLEVDRGTIPNTRNPYGSNWRKSIAYKLSTYWHGWLAGQQKSNLG